MLDERFWVLEVNEFGSGNSIKRFAAAVMAFKLENTPIVKFNNGIEFPIFGLGTWKVSHSVHKCVGFSCRPAYVS